jgi:hypothetical protein
MRNKLMDALKTGDIVPVKIVDLLNTLDGSIDVGDDDWVAGMFASKVMDYQMGGLIESLLDRGLCTPLNLVHDRYQQHGKIVMGNGHHRLVAALLCGIEEIDVYVTDWIDHARSSEENDWDFSSRVFPDFQFYSAYLHDAYFSALELIS